MKYLVKYKVETEKSVFVEAENIEELSKEELEEKVLNSTNDFEEAAISTPEIIKVEKVEEEEEEKEEEERVEDKEEGLKMEREED